MLGSRRLASGIHSSCIQTVSWHRLPSVSGGHCLLAVSNRGTFVVPRLLPGSSHRVLPCVSLRTGLEGGFHDTTVDAQGVLQAVEMKSM